MLFCIIPEGGEIIICDCSFSIGFFLINQRQFPSNLHCSTLNWYIKDIANGKDSKQSKKKYKLVLA